MHFKNLLLMALLFLILSSVIVTFVSAKPIYAQPATPTCSNPDCNPWGFNFQRGKHIFHPPAGFCAVFTCIRYFWHGKGYVVECRDAQYSHSGGRRGACSFHHGEWRALYAH
jgi:hypothetical protein